MFVYDEIEAGTLTGKLRELLVQLDKWQDLIGKALDGAYGTHTYDDVVRMVLLNQVHFYDRGNCCIFMIVDTYPQHSNYHCFIACGDMQGIIDAEPLIRDNAKALGCKYMSITGRTGWPRALKEHGWKHQLSTLFKEV